MRHQSVLGGHRGLFRAVGHVRHRGVVGDVPQELDRHGGGDDVFQLRRHSVPDGGRLRQLQSGLATGRAADHKVVTVTAVRVRPTGVRHICSVVRRDVPQVDPALMPVVRTLLKTFSVLSYGDFDDFHDLRNVTELSKLKHLNLTELLVKVTDRSKSFFYPFRIVTTDQRRRYRVECPTGGARKTKVARVGAQRFFNPDFSGFFFSKKLKLNF